MAVKLLIIGGVAGGATAAARARRLDEEAEIILFERGEFISFASCGLPYYIGEIIKKRNDLLVTTAKFFSKRYKIDVRTFTEVVSIDRERKQVQARDHKKGETYRESYDKIILSPGAKPLKPPLEGIELDNIFSLRTIPDADNIKAFINAENPQSGVIIGGGFIGLEMAEALAERGLRVTVIEMLDQVLAPLDPEMAGIVQAYLKEKGVTCVLGDGVKSFSQKSDRLLVSTNAGLEIETGMVILSIGIKPENELAREAGLDLGGRGGIIVDEGMRTSDPDIFAVGDAVETKDLVTGQPAMTALAGPANKQGRIAADNAMGRKSVFRGTLGTAVVKIFDLTVALTGASEKTLKKVDIPYVVSYTHSSSHAGYYPDPKTMSIKLVFSPEDGKILGAQIIGEKGVDKRIDVLATALRGQMTVYDLEELELAYAPPYSSAKDPVNIAGFVAANILKGDVENVYLKELLEQDREDSIVLDLRDRSERDASGKIEGSLHVPLNDLRDKLPELDRDQNYIPYCAVGLRAYIGHRILVQNGFKSRNLSGGFRTYLGARGELMKESS